MKIVWIAVRWFLGMFEAGFYPGNTIICYYVSLIHGITRCRVFFQLVSFQAGDITMLSVNESQHSWYKRSEFGFRTAIFSSMATVSGAFGGLKSPAVRLRQTLTGYSRTSSRGHLQNGRCGRKTSMGKRLHCLSFFLLSLRLGMDFYFGRPSDYNSRVSLLPYNSRLSRNRQILDRRGTQVHHPEVKRRWSV